eukprot:gene222-238_t
MRVSSRLVPGVTSLLALSIVLSCAQNSVRPIDAELVTPSDQVFPSKVKVVHFVRHAEGHHNVAGKKSPLKGFLRSDLEDAQITPKGVSQCQKLRDESKQIISGAQLVVTSPMHRTMQTASHSFPHLVGKVPWVAVEHLRERTGLHPCDRRRPISEHKKVYEHIDFGQIIEDKDPLFSQYLLREPLSKVEERARAFLEWLHSREENEIVVVSHSNFLRILFQKVLCEDWAEFEKNPQEKFQHCELRTVVMRLPRLTAPPQ